MHDRVLAAPAGLAPPSPCTPRWPRRCRRKRKRREVAHVGIGEQHDVAAVAAVAAVGAALRHELLAPEGDAAVTAAPGLHDHGRAIVEVAFAAHAAACAAR